MRWPLARRAASVLFQVISQRYVKTSIILTSKRGVGSWGEIRRRSPGPLLHRSVVLLTLDGDSYRLRDHHARADTLRATARTRHPLS